MSVFTQAQPPDGTDGMSELNHKINTALSDYFSMLEENPNAEIFVDVKTSLVDAITACTVAYMLIDVMEDSNDS